MTCNNIVMPIAFYCVGTIELRNKRFDTIIIYIYIVRTSYICISNRYIMHETTIYFLIITPVCIVNNPLRFIFKYRIDVF